MARYYFDVHDGVSLIDEDGVELASLTEARAEAVRASAGMLRGKAEFWSGEGWRMEVRDESGKIVATLNLSAS